MKISTKIILFFSALLVVSLTLSVGLVLVESAANCDKSSVGREQSALADLENMTKVYLGESANEALLLADSSAVIDAVSAKDSDKLLKFLNNANSTIGLDVITVADAQGNVIARQHQPDKKGDSVLNQSNVVKALAGDYSSTIEAGTATSLSCRSGAPIKDSSGNIIGAIVTGYAFNNANIIDTLKKFHNMDFSVYSTTALLGTTIMNKGQRASDLTLSKEISDAVLTKGGVYTGKQTLYGTAYLTMVAPLKDTSGKIVGALGVDLLEADSQASVTATFLQVLIIVPVIIAVLLIISYLFVRRSVKAPMVKITEASDKLAAGDTDIDVDIKTNDEAGQLSRAFKGVVETIKKMSSELKVLISEVSEGRYGTRADSAAYNGEYRTIIENVNNTIDLFVANLDKIPSPILSINKEFGVEYINSAGAAIAGRSAAELIGMKCYDIFRTEDCKTTNCACFRAMDKKAKAESETTARPNDDTKLEIKYSGTPIIKNGEAVGAFEVITDLTEIKQARRKAEKHAESLTALLTDVSTAAYQVAEGTKQMSAGSQTISQGAVEQASSIEELSSTITEIAGQTVENTAKIGKAKDLSYNARKESVEGNEQMKALKVAMDEINESSEKISKIIKVVDDIAFQTNILALNASVEAARAGVHGKGFAVVAEEVRNLAGRSAQAAKQTTELIEGSMQKVEVGAGLADSTLKSLERIIAGAEESVQYMDEITAASEEQAKGIAMINQGIEQLSEVVQMNSATAEEAAATSEEISSQADALNDMVAKFNNNSD